MLQLVTAQLDKKTLIALCQAHFETMVKFVADTARGYLAVGGEMHADCEALLLAEGSNQRDLWGGNLYPWNEPGERIEFTSFINIRPADDNPAMEIINEDIRKLVIRLVETLLLSPSESMPGAA